MVLSDRSSCLVGGRADRVAGRYPLRGVRRLRLEGIGLAYLEHAPVEVIDADRIRCRRPPTAAPPIDAASAPGDYRINQVPGGR